MLFCIEFSHKLYSTLKQTSKDACCLSKCAIGYKCKFFIRLDIVEALTKEILIEYSCNKIIVYIKILNHNVLNVCTAVPKKRDQLLLE